MLLFSNEIKFFSFKSKDIKLFISSLNDSLFNIFEYSISGISPKSTFILIYSF